MKPAESLSIAEQMKVLQSGDDVSMWALAHLGMPQEWRYTNEEGNTERCQEAVNRLFTLTRADIEASLAAQGLELEKLPLTFTKPGSHDGSYFITNGKGKGEWEYYYQERGCRWASETFNDLGEARKLLLNEWIPIWLEHLRVPCRTKEGRVIETL